MNPRNFFAELKRRHVYKVAIAYAIVGWLLVQVATQVFPFFEIPNWAVRLVVLVIIIGFPIALVIAWAFELTPEGLKRTEFADELPTKSLRSRVWIYVVIIAGAISVSLFFLGRYTSSKQSGGAELPAKSIAVLPFENFSEDKAFAFFADGVQDEILTDLAKIADLKVISRTSVMQYKNTATRNLPEIAQALKVAHVLEGSVQRSANRVRVSAQLIDARNDTHVWAEKYDRELADVFAIQSEIAQKIADQLQAKLSPKEKAGLQANPTKDLVAYDLYLRAREIERNNVTSIGVGGNDEAKREIPLLEEAIHRDPTFVPALCALVHVRLYLYWQGADQSDANLSAAKEALEAAARLQPDAGEVHFARAELYYRGSRDYESALAELHLAARSLPNDSDVPFTIALIERRQGKFDDAIRQSEQAIAADPRNLGMISETVITYAGVRRYSDAAKTVDSALAWKPLDFGLRYLRANLDLNWKADLGLWKALIVSETAQVAKASDLADARFDLAIKERDYHTAEQVLAGNQVAELDNPGFFIPKEWNEAIIARGLGDKTKADAAFLSARNRAAAAVRERPEDGRSLIVLAEIDAALGRKEDALREGQHATELLPVAKDALNGAGIANKLAGIYAQVDLSERALDELEKKGRLPFGPTYGSLKLDAVWDPLRRNPRFEKIVASLAPKDLPAQSK